MMSRSIEEYAKPTRIAYELFYLAETPEGTLSLLPEVIRSLEKDRKCKDKYHKLMMNLAHEDIEIRKQKQIVIDWLLSKLKQLRKLSCYQYVEVEKSINIAEKFLTGEFYEASSGGFLSVLVDHFENACRKVAACGCTSEISDWLVVSVKEEQMIFNTTIINNPNFYEEISPYSNDGKLIADSLNHGFIKASVLPGTDFFSEDAAVRYKIAWGCIDRIIYPEALKIWLMHQDITQWRVRLDHSAEQNLRDLLSLCFFKDLIAIPQDTVPRPKSVFEAEELSNRIFLNLFFHSFRSNWDKAKMSREEIMGKLDRLLVFLLSEESIESVRGKRSIKECAREFVQNALENKWEGLNGSKPSNYKVLRMAVLKAQTTIEDNNLRKAISDTLREKEIRKFAKQKKIKTVRGKDHGPRHTI